MLCGSGGFDRKWMGLAHHGGERGMGLSEMGLGLSEMGWGSVRRGGAQ